jgi:Spy/CpxP family protein refolding chaperone
MAKKGLYILLIGMLISGVLLFSGCRRHSHGHKLEFMVDYISETLDLNENQQAQLSQVKDEVMTKAGQLRTDKESMREELIAQLRSEEIDEVRVKAVIAEHRAQMDEVVDLIVDRLSEFHKTLTPEQKEKLVAKIETFKKWHHRDLE